MEQHAKMELAIENISKLYCTLSQECLADLKPYADILCCTKNAILLKEGDYSETVYFIIEGSARAFYLKDGKDVSDWFAFENDFICSINSFFLDIPSPHYIETMEPATLLAIPKKQHEKLLYKHRDFERLGRLVVTKTMLQLQQRIMAVQFETAQQKYENLLTVKPDITQRVPLSHIASYLGITLETLSRIRRPKGQI